MKDEIHEYFALHDPVRDRYLGFQGFGVAYACDARRFKTVDDAAKQRDAWWQNKRFSDVVVVRVTARTIE